MKTSTALEKTALYMFIFSLALLILIACRQFLIPLLLAMLLSFLLLPISTFLERKGLHRGISIIISILIAFILISGIVYFIYYQIAGFVKDAPMLKLKLNEKILELQSYITNKFNVSQWEQNKWFNEQTDNLLASSGQYLTDIFQFTGTLLATIGLLPIYVFFMTMYRDKVKLFICQITPPDQNEHILGVARKTASVSQKYIRGLLIDIFILSVLNSLGFILLGLDYAILLGVLAAILNLIPYIGVLIGSIFPFLMALLTNDSTSVAIGTIGVCAAVQFLDNNFITPKVVGSSVSINPLATLIAIIIGGLIWGVAGMMLFIPLLGILKVILDNFPSSQPFGYLIGEEEKMKPKITISSIRKIILLKKG